MWRRIYSPGWGCRSGARYFVLPSGALRAGRLGSRTPSWRNIYPMYRRRMLDAEGLYGGGPRDHGVVAAAQTSMRVVCKTGEPPRFPFREFDRAQRAYDTGDTKKSWRDAKALADAALGVGIDAQILGHIEPDLARDWLGWDSPGGTGKIYAVGYRGTVWYCIPGGTSVWW
jgi:hypothetical protein